MSGTEDYRDTFMKFRLKDWLNAIMYSTAMLVCIIILTGCAYITICAIDRKPPIEEMQYKASDAKIGGNTTVTMSFFRTRICAYSFIRMVTDSKGRIVYQDQGSRPVNGPIRRIEITEDYHIAANAAPGKAVMHLYAYWSCPGNIIHKIYPIHKEYTDTLELSLNEGDVDLSNMSEDEAVEYMAREQNDKEMAAKREEERNNIARKLFREQQENENASRKGR